MTEAEALKEIEGRHVVAVMAGWRARALGARDPYRRRFLLLREALSDLYERSSTDWTVSYSPGTFRIEPTDNDLRPAARQLAAFGLVQWLGPQLVSQPPTEWLTVLRAIDAAGQESCGDGRLAGSLAAK